MAGYIGSKSSVTQVDGYTRDETDALVPTSIDDNGNATALTIDSSENVLVGKTSSSTTTAGNELRAGGLAAFTRSGSYSLNLNRLASDGDIAVFQKDNTTVGRIGSNGTASWIACPAGSGAGLRFDGGDNRIVPTEGDGTNRNAAVDLGYSSSRFKDAYLSGGVYLGGTGSANKLDDYEEGTFTPYYDLSSTSISSVSYHSITGGFYRKIGKYVFISGILYTTGVTIGSGSGTLRIEGLPFSVSHFGNSQSGYSSIYVGESANFTGDHPSSGRVIPNNTAIDLFYRTSPNGPNLTNNGGDLNTGTNVNLLRFSGSYSTG